MLKIRPHHILCMMHFTGKGYDEAFTEGMTSVIRKLRTEPLTLVCGCDDICTCCPNLCGSGCRTDEKVKRYDDKVRQLLSLQDGQTYFLKDLKKIAKDEIMDRDGVGTVCADCEWFSLCSNLKEIDYE